MDELYHHPGAGIGLSQVSSPGKTIRVGRISRRHRFSVQWVRRVNRDKTYLRISDDTYRSGNAF